MAQSMPNFNLPAFAEAPGIEWEALGKGTAEMSSSTLPYDAPIHTFRSRVPGGWLVMVMTCGTNSTLTFLPDPFHEWTGRSLRPLG